MKQTPVLLEAGRLFAAGRFAAAGLLRVGMAAGYLV